MTIGKLALAAALIFSTATSDAAEKWNRIVVDIGSGTVSPADPVVNTASGTDVSVTILKDGKAVKVDEVLFRLPRTVYHFASSGKLEALSDSDGVTIRGSSLTLNFKKCKAVLDLDRTARPDVICPTIVITPNQLLGPDERRTNIEAAPVVSVYSDNDGVELFAEYSQNGRFDDSTIRIPVLIGVVKRRAGLSWSAGLSFFDDADEKWGVRAIPDNEDEQQLIRLDDASAPYRLSATANYMGMFGPPSLGVSFGVATDVPFESLATTFGLTFTIRTLPIADSANLTAGIAYAPHKVLAAEYRDLTRLPTGVAASTLTIDQHDVGWFVGISFNFAGGEDQFKTVFSGGGKKEETEP